MLRLTRKADGAVITFVRSDGSVTSSRSRDGGFFAMHDLMHYAVEAALGYRRAFLGLLAEGVEIRDWEDAASEARRETPEEALQAEALVGLLQLRWASGGADGIRRADPEVLAAEMEPGCRKGGARPARVTLEQLARIADAYEESTGRWMSLPVGETLELPWPPRDSAT